MKQRPIYPKEINYYLDELTKGYGLWSSKILYEEEVEKPYYQKNTKNGKDVDDLKDKVKYILFDDNFREKAKRLIKEDNQKGFLLDVLKRITTGQKRYFMNEKFVCYKDFFYSLFVAKEAKPEGKLRINFGIFFEKTPRIKPFSTYILKIIFFDFGEDLKINFPKNYEKIIYHFERNFGENNNDLEYDKMIFLGENKEKLFYYSEDNSKDYYYPYPYELPTKNEIYKKINIFGTEYIQGFNMKIWDLKYPIDIVLNNLYELNKFNYNGFFEKDVLDFHPSKIETNLINMNENFILSGRPGTGKTVIILIKVIMFYLRCLFDHSKIIEGEVDYNYINNNLISNIYLDKEKYSNEEKESENNLINMPIKSEKNIKINSIEAKESNSDENNFEGKKLGSEGETYKIVFTSLSQSLCAYVESYFIRGIKNSQIPLNIVNTNQKIYEKMSSFAHHKKYPLFLNFRKLLFMIDGSLNYQFFDRPNNNQLKKRQDDCDIRYYPDCEYDVMADLSVLRKKPGNPYFYRRKYLSNPLVMTEINENSFYNEFDLIIKNNKTLNNDKNSISTYEVYSNIISIIKGSVKSYLAGYLSEEDYYRLGKKICPFNLDQKKEIYKIFQRYEIWKAQNKYFDMQDLVNYLIHEVNIELVPQNRKLLDLVFIDEIQDFSINQLYLLLLITRDIKVMAGDTCQTISKINTFRFADLNNVLYTIGELKNIKIKEPRHIEINLNFRCHANILRFAHLVYEMIHYFFINTLDKVRMDFSTKVGGGEKPFLIPNKIIIEEKNKNLKIISDKNGLDYFLKGLSENNLFLDDEKSIINTTFSVNHCVICRNNDIIKDLNKKYNSKIFCSTIYESKGLEYEIVIIYNFFKDSLPFVQEIWKYILKNIRFNKVENNYLSLVKQNLEYENISSSIKDAIYTIFKDKINIDFPPNMNEQLSLFNFCSELKEFYVAITRTKSRLFIYEENMELLKLFIERINDLDILVQDIFIKKKEEKIDDNTKNYIYVEKIGDTFNLLNRKVNGLLNFLNRSRTTKEKLEETGYNEYNEDNEYNYKKALYLFQVINNDLMKNKCLINLKYIEMQKIKGTKNEDLKRKYILINQEILDLINKINYDDERQIKGEVLLNLEKYDDALDYFISKNNYKKCGIALIKQKKYEQALEYFLKGKEYSFAVYCLIENCQYNKLYLFLLKYKEQFDLEHIQYYYKITCDKFFKKYIIPTKNYDKLMREFNIMKQKEKNKENNTVDDNKKIIIKDIISYDMNKNENKIYLDKENKLFSLLNENKIKIKSPFIFSPNSDYNIFDIDKSDKNNIYNLQKTKEQIIFLINAFKEIINYMSVYLQIIITKTEETKKQTLFLKKCKELISYIEEKMTNLENNSENEIEELLKIMEYLEIKEHDNRMIMKGILNNIEAKKNIYDLLDILIFKANILDIINEYLPILKQNQKKGNKINYNILYKESIQQLVDFSKYLPLNYTNIIKNLKSTLILNNYYEGLLGLISYNDISSLLNLSIILNKQKLFELIIKKLDIDFVKGKVNNNEYKNLNISIYKILYYMNSYICMLYHKFFKYILSDKKNENKIITLLSKIKIFPKIYNILSGISSEKNSNAYSSNYLELIREIDEYFVYCKNVKSNINDNNYQRLSNFILIGSELSLLIYLYGNNILSMNLDINSNNNLDLLNKHIIIISKIQIIIDLISSFDEKVITNDIPLNSFLNAFAYLIEDDIISSTNINNKDKNIIQKYYLDLNHQHNSEKGTFSKYIEKISDFLFNYKIKISDLIKLNINNLLNKDIYLYILNIPCDEEIEEKNAIKLGKYYWIDETQFNNIIKYLNELPYDGEYYLNDLQKLNDIEQSKIIFNKNKTIYKDIINEIVSDIGNKKDYMNSSFIKLINYILYSNLIGGMIKIDYRNASRYNNENNHKTSVIDEYYLNKNFSYSLALDLINSFYNKNINQLLIIIWLKKIYNYLYGYFYDIKNKEDNKFKLYKNKSGIDKKLNIYNIKNIISEDKNDNGRFLEKYINSLSLFIKENKKLKTKENIKSDIINYFSQIFYSLKSLFENSDYIKNNNNINRKISFLLDEMKSSGLLTDKKEVFKEVMIVYDEKLKNDIIYEEMEKFNISIEDEKNESYEEDDYDDDYDEIESSLLQKIEDRNMRKFY